MDPNEDQFYAYSTNRRSDLPLVPVAQTNASDRHYQQQQLMNRTSNFGLTLQQNSLARASYIEPQLKSPLAPPMFRKDAWTTELENMNKISNSNVLVGNEPSKISSSMNNICSKMSSSKAAILMCGLMLCGVPLAVMTTLWLKSSTAAVVLPTQCYAYTSDTSTSRAVTYVCGGCYCDSSLTNGANWYRFLSTAGIMLVTTQLSTTSICGTSYPAWFNGSFPSTVGSTTTGNICIYNGSPCGVSYSPISVTNCSGYYVFYLVTLPYSCSRYCVTN
ncbi:unnamed protein product [Didymodactylos carnosus]|uniref:Uncharacterized protein n=1 Tax=Didymodactylos carnosus TaxID=1234261 RepID=A0A815KW63_9BILA|nr:unnamed protein product [Didymodactylos carnosus]CAF4294952.1 unnamed protein product [Didymodactylos carnosus]